ncbi:MAG: type II secretion system protein [Candidatus Omnitrophica bacterium]|nr:type II secretion system protein [Candidatus Omnitrophota bacterium]
MKLSKSFTLIELILVVAIIAILAGVMVPFILSARQKARAAKLAQLFDTIANACRLHYSDTGRYASEFSNAPIANWNMHNLSVIPPANAIPGWDGPYIDRPLTNKDAYIGDMLFVSSQILWDFDLDGDGSVDKNQFTAGNSLDLWWVNEAQAKAINDAIDMSVPGDWRVTGKVVFYGALAFPVDGIAVYLTGGS